jgi:AraC family transcriptional regulator
MQTATLARTPALPTVNGFAGAPWRRLDAPSPRVRVPATPAAMRLDYQGARSVRQMQKSWTGVIANMAEIRGDGSVQVDLNAADPRLSVVLEEVGGRFSIETEGWRGQPVPRDAPQPLSVIPAGIAARGRGDGMRFVRHLVLQFEAAPLARMMDDEIDLTNVLKLRPMFLEPGIMRLAQLFAAECEGDQPHSRLYGDNLSMALLLALSRLTGAKPSRPIRQGQLAPWQLRRVTDYLAAHLAEDVPLQTLSDLVKLSRSYFSRAFKISTGLAPHQWLLQARIGKAKQLLLDTDRPLAQIAIDVGFADQAHFTRTFRREAGESPGAWQRARFA